MKDWRPYEVLVQIVTTATFVVEARTPEEAEATAETWVEDGEDGDEVSRDVEILEVTPVDQGSLGEVVEES